MTTKGIDVLYRAITSPDEAYRKASRDIQDLQKRRRLTPEEAWALAEYNQQKHREHVKRALARKLQKRLVYTKEVEEIKRS